MSSQFPDPRTGQRPSLQRGPSPQLVPPHSSLVTRHSSLVSSHFPNKSKNRGGAFSVAVSIAGLLPLGRRPLRLSYIATMLMTVLQGLGPAVPMARERTQ